MRKPKELAYVLIYFILATTLASCYLPIKYHHVEDCRPGNE